MSGSPARKAIAFGALIAIIAILVPFGVACSKPPRPTANFTFSYVSGERLLEDPIAGLAPLTVRFSDQSTGDITSWRWSLGDGTVVEGERDFAHTYNTPNSSGYIVVLEVSGPGGKDDHEELSVVTVFSCSEAANAELSQARQAIKDCLKAAGTNNVDSEVLGWDGGRGKVTAGAGVDAADYLGVWNTFKATYEVALDGTIDYGTDISWGCIFWNPNALGGSRWTAT